jgi:formate C-acetyltransferase
MEDRVKKLVERMRTKPPRVSVERARLYTEAMKRHEGKPEILRQALAIKHVLENIPVQIFPGELIVGVMVPDPPGAILYPEGIGLWILNELDAISRRETNPLQITKEDAEFIKEASSYWSERTIEAYSSHLMPKEITEQLYTASVYVLTEVAGISHFAVNHPYLLSKGFRQIAEESRLKRARLEEGFLGDPKTMERILFYKASEIVSEGMISLGKRYAHKAREMAEKGEGKGEELLKIAEICERVPADPPRSFWEALQFVWFVQLALHQENYEQGISMGPLDQYLYPYFKRDLEKGLIDRKRALELIRCLWIKTCEIVPLFTSTIERFCFSGQLTNQAITLSGRNPEGRDMTNELTYLMLEATVGNRLRQPNVHVRIHRNSPEELIKRLAEAIQAGGNVLALFNDEACIQALEKIGIPREEAARYATIGCVELAPFGNSFTSSDAALMNVAMALELALNRGRSRVLGLQMGPDTGDPKEFRSMKDLLRAFRIQLSHILKNVTTGCNVLEYTHRQMKPTPLLSLCVEGPFERGEDVNTGSTKYNFTEVQAVGLATVADSLAAVDRVVFRDHFCSMAELVEALDRDFEGYEELRRRLLGAPKYGNDEDFADEYMKVVTDMYVEELGKYRNVRGNRFIPGCYPATLHVGFGYWTGALPDGRKAGRPLSNGVCPSPGSQRKGLTAAMRSVCKIDHTKFAGGVSYTVSLHRDLVRGEKGLHVLSSLLRSYVELGGMHLQFNVLSPEVLREAQKHPELYRDLLVRVSGWSAYFVQLSKDVQDEIIERLTGEI